MQEPRQCGEVTEEGEPNAIPVYSATVRGCLPRGVASARRLPAAALRARSDRRGPWRAMVAVESVLAALPPDATRDGALSEWAGWHHACLWSLAGA